MTVSVDDTVERYTISGVGPYAFSFRIFADTDLALNACSTASPPVPVPLTYLTHYTVAGANDADGGTVTLTSGAATTYAGYTLDIRSNTPEEQPTSIRNLGRFLPDIHEEAFDRLSRQVQDLSRKVTASFRYPDNVISDGAMSSIANWVSKYLAVGPTGLIEPASSIGSVALTSSLIGTTLDSLVRTAGEISAEVTPVNYAYLPDDSRRYGTVANGVTNNDAAIANIMAVLEEQGGGEMHFRGAGAIMINDDIVLPSNVTIYCETTIKRSGTGGTYDACFVGAPGATDITLINPRIDCNNQLGMGGIIFRADNLRFRVLGGEIRNCAHDPGTPPTNKLGGRALNIEAGVSDTTDPKSSCIIGVSIIDCYMAIAISGGDAQEDANCTISGITATNCEVLIGMFGNAAGYPHAGDSMSYVISDIIAQNCGKSVTYSRAAGIICADRGCNVLISNVYIFNDSTYATTSTVASVLYGDFANVRISNLVYDGNCGSLYAGYGWQEANSITDGGYVTQRNQWQVTINGTINDVIAASVATAGRITDSELDLTVQTIGNNRAVTSALAAQTSVFLRLREYDDNILWEGFTSDMVTGYALDASAGLGKRVLIGPFSTFDANQNVYDQRLYTLNGSATWDPASIAVGARATTTVTVTGAALGDHCLASFSNDLQGLGISAAVASANNVAVTLLNNTAGAIDPASGTVRVRVWKQ